MSKKNSIKMSKSVSQRVILLLKEEGKMTPDEIAQKLGKSKSSVNRVANGQATLSVEELGRLTISVGRTLGSPIVKKISEITMEDVKENLEKAKDAAGDAIKGIAHNAPGVTANASKKVLKTTAKALETAGQFLRGLVS